MAQWMIINVCSTNKYMLHMTAAYVSSYNLVSFTASVKHKDRGKSIHSLLTEEQNKQYILQRQINFFTHDVLKEYLYSIRCIFLTLKDCSDMNAPFIIKSIAYYDPVFLHGGIKVQFKIQLFSIQWSFCTL